MARRDHENGGLPEMSTRKMFQILLQEIVDVRRELKEDIAGLDRKFSKDFQALRTDFQALRTDFQALRIEVHQNQVTFMKNHEELEQRVTALETAA